jgi:exonuclease III
MKSVRIINWNIANPSKEKFEQQLKLFVHINADILCLTESGDFNKNSYIREKAYEIGYDVYTKDEYIDKYSSIILVKRNSIIKVVRVVQTNTSSRTIALDVEVHSRPLRLVVTYFPANNRKEISKKKKHFDELFTFLAMSRKKENILLIGDFNTVKRKHIPKFNWFRLWEYEVFDRLEELNLVDGTELVNKDCNYSWYGNHNIGHLYDYFYVNRDIADTVKGSYFDKDVINKKLSDHAIQYISLGFD